MERNTQYRLSEHINYEIRGGDEEKVLIIPNYNNVPDMKRVLCLSGTTLYIWRMLADQKSHGQMIEEMVQSYHRERKEVERDLTEFLSQLLEKGYISIMD